MTTQQGEADESGTLPHDSDPCLSVTSATQLRQLLASDLRSKRTVRFALSGLLLDSPLKHSVLQRSFSRIGLGDERPHSLPRQVILDWSTVETVTADGVAYFSVLLRHLTASGFRVIVCSPACTDVLQALVRAGVRQDPPSVLWIPEPPVVSNRATVLVPAAMFGGPRGRGNAEEFVLAMPQEFAKLPLRRARADFVEAVVLDLFQNAFAHTDGAHAAAVAMVHGRRRPPRLCLGFADSGPGIAGSVLAQLQHRRLGQFTDLHVVENVLHNALSGRPGGGGGLTRLLREFTTHCNGEVLIRSGAALLRISRAGLEGTRLSGGFGTQILVTVDCSD